MRALFPEIEPFDSFYLKTASAHKIYVEQCGNRNGVPVVFLHGGPGSGCNPNHRRYFCPDTYRIVIFDQRGCHRSTPRGDVNDNSTDLILQDIEEIRNRLDIKRWLLFGGSWGATLALLYAESFPENISGIILRGSFLARQRDLDWFIKDGVSRIFPQQWETLNSIVDETSRGDLISAYYKLIHHGSEEEKKAAAEIWSDWCTRIVTWNLPVTESDSEERQPDFDETQKIIDEVSIETHYAKHRYFIEDNQILLNISQVPAVPVHIIHGRQDITCLPESSWLLHNSLPDSTLQWLPNSGHLAGEPAMIDALVSATDRFAKILK